MAGRCNCRALVICWYWESPLIIHTGSATACCQLQSWSHVCSEDMQGMSKLNAHLALCRLCYGQSLSRQGAGMCSLSISGWRWANGLCQSPQLLPTL